MTLTKTFRPFFLLLVMTALVLSGCSGGPFGDLSFSSHPEETEYGPTPHEMMATIRNLGNSAKTLSPEKQESASTQLLAQLQTDPDPIIRCEIVRALGRFPTTSAVKGLKIACEDGDSLVRIAVCDAWAQRKGSDAIEELGHLVSMDSDIDVRLAAARALGQFKDQQAVTVLASALEDRDPAIRHRTIASMKRISGRNYKDIDSWRRYAASESPVAKKDRTSVASKAWWEFY